ncbi:RuvC family protein [Xanthobacter agilis]|uniref:Crossover junction endodeoxyribonuclease RuvC n=1 Tax=Xanthobacter agilis TaxID=47492 RepID=A0ABU0LFR4_XANAG|nr:hypothetical protein [Xanthobacter agilis]MDQ0505971.1 crossover junction endodeoxyribonuclease RuvC [Xanthobacter agilis]
MIILGVDPGLNGAFAILGDGALIEAADLPTMGEGARRRLDSGAWSDTLRLTRFDLAVVEQVGAMPGQGVSSMFRFGYAAGQIIGVIDALRIPVKWVSPASWKRSMNIGADKEKSRALAIETFPDLRDRFRRKADHGRAEAALIALWGARTQNGRA